MSLELSDEQQNVVNEVLEWISCYYTDYLTLGGYAGTGKTTILSHLSLTDEFKKLKIAYCCFTGKSTFVLKNKLEEQGRIKFTDTVSTIHTLMYIPKTVVDEDGKEIIIEWKKKKTLDGIDLIVVDEASMISKEILNDLLSYKIPLLAVGDIGQLPPIGEKTSLLKNTNLVLKTVHRQALNNPIIQLSVQIRQQGYIPHGKYGNSVFKISWGHKDTQNFFDNIEWDDNIIALCGFNKTRIDINSIIRKKKEFLLEDPYPGERVICLKNNHDAGIMNGQLGSVAWDKPLSKEASMLTIDMDGAGGLQKYMTYMPTFNTTNLNEIFAKPLRKLHGSILRKYNCDRFNFFDFGYCVTVHKSQGSEWDKVVMFEQRNKYQTDQDYARWLYTGVTRAKEKLMIITDYY